MTKGVLFVVAVIIAAFVVVPAVLGLVTSIFVPVALIGGGFVAGRMTAKPALPAARRGGYIKG